MILFFLRVIFGVALGYVVYNAWENGRTNLEGGDVLNAGYVAVSVALAIANALVWAPFIGSRIAEPITGNITGSTYVERKNHLLRWIQSLDHRGKSWLVRWLCFVEGVRHPRQPTQFVIGLMNARPGSWLEKVYAREVYRFNNIQNCVLAYHALRRHGINAGPHSNHEVNLVLTSLERGPRPDPERLAVPKAPPPAALRRNDKIRLFVGAPSSGASSEPAAESSGTAQGSAAQSATESTAVLPTRWQLWRERIWRFIETH